MGEWKEWKICDLGEVLTGKTPSKNNPEDWGDEMPFVTPSDFKNYRKSVFFSERNLSQIGVNRLKNKVLPVNSILVTCIGSDMGKVVMNEVKVITNQQINSIVPNRKIVNNDYLYYSLIDMYEILRVYGGDGTAVPIVNKGDFENLGIQFPTLSEQKAIAGVLSSLDDKINLLHRQNKTLESLAETLFRQWFVEEAKEDWGEKPLSSIANFLNGIACQKHLPKNEIDKLPVLKIKELNSGISENSDWASTDIKPEYVIETGDVIFAWSASLMVKVWGGEKCILNQHLFKVTSSEFPKWFYLMWCKHHLKKFISISSSHATTMGHIKRSDLDNAMVYVPCDDELTVMSNQMTPLLGKQIKIVKQIRTLEKMRDTLLPKLMSGELRVCNG